MLISMNWISDFVDLTGLDKMALIRQFSLSTAEGRRIPDDEARRLAQAEIEKLLRV